MAEYVIYHPEAERELLFSAGFRRALEQICDDIARDASIAAPKETGRGAKSIHGEVLASADGWEGRVSWTRDRYYMYMQEKGWTARGRKVPARPFLRPAAERRRGV